MGVSWKGEGEHPLVPVPVLYSDTAEDRGTQRLFRVRVKVRVIVVRVIVVRVIRNRVRVRDTVRAGLPDPGPNIIGGPRSPQECL